MALNVETAAQRQAREFAERSIRRLAMHLDKLARVKVRPIVVGGWAVTAHGSPLGSRDIDALIRMKDQRAAGDALGNTDFVARDLDGDGLFDYAFYEAVNRSRVGLPYEFEYRRILDGHVETKRLSYPGGSVTIRVPDATALLFLKAKAFTDRSHSYWLRTHLDELKRHEDDTKRLILADSEAYWAAKAAKDMDDIAFLATLPIRRNRLRNLIDAAGLRPYLIREWTRRSPELYAVADGIRREAGLDPGFVPSRYDAVLELIS